MPQILIIGAGIGGLTLAAALHKTSIDVTIVEQASAIEAVGAGLTLQPNAVTALRRMGIADALEQHAAVLQTGTLSTSDGRIITRITPSIADRLIRAVGAPVWGIHRATLHDILQETSASSTLRLNARVTDVQPDTGKVTLSTGETLQADLVIGADGLHSITRTAVVGPTAIRYAGYTCWRGVTPTEQFSDTWSGEYWGRGERFGGCAIDGGRTYWFAIKNAPAGGQDPDGAKNAALTLSESFPSPVQATVAKTAAENVFRTDIHDRAPIQQWVRGRTALLGDAAHPMTPNWGQGACQAIEDALVLSTTIQQHGLTTLALDSYHKQRVKRANTFVKQARNIGRIGQVQTSLICGIRDTVARLLPVELSARQLQRAWTLPY